MQTVAPRRRVRLEISGAVQGVGFRPFVYRLAQELGASGWIANDARGVVLEAEGDAAMLLRLLSRVRSGAPRQARLHAIREEWLEPTGSERFEIVASEGAGTRAAFVLPDIAACAPCLREVRSRDDRRHGYAFTNCTDCGPRFSIITALPYDRPGTTMAGFRMCRACRAEYDDPADRRFHAQPNACPECGPRLSLLHADGSTAVPAGDDAAVLDAAAAALNDGRIVAVKGLGGYQLMADAGNDGVVERLRRRKGRPSRPLAVMVADIETARGLCRIDATEAELLQSSEAPIVILRRRGRALASGIAPGNPTLGLMLPATPLHHLLLRKAGVPLVATSGNRSEEPICTTEVDALERLGAIADLFLVHDRPIQRHVDDSVAWVAAGAPRLFRRARGYAPLPVTLPWPAPPTLAVGAHLKNTVAVASGDFVFLSQHIGDLTAPEARRAFEAVIGDLLGFYGIAPALIAHDLHPDYASTAWAVAHAERYGAELVPVQHHHAHLASCLAGNGVTGTALGVVWDGAGYGADGTIWGGEFLCGDAGSYRRAAHLLPFRLPGGDAAVADPRRVAVALLDQARETSADMPDLPPFRSLPPASVRVFRQLVADASPHAPVTSSAGRLFDGIAALLGLKETVSFEGEAAMALEHVAAAGERGAYPVELGTAAPPLPADAPGTAGRGATIVLDWRPLVRAVAEDLAAGVAVSTIAARVHNGLAAAIVGVAQEAGESRVALSGGCFQNRLLLERAASGLRRAGFEVLLHGEVPPNDGGISLGQVAVATARLTRAGRGPVGRPVLRS
jgi:hydrogenase maturation protein HypF